jgi:hypothetical protein
MPGDPVLAGVERLRQPFPDVIQRVDGYDLHGVVVQGQAEGHAPADIPDVSRKLGGRFANDWPERTGELGPTTRLEEPLGLSGWPWHHEMDGGDRRFEEP